MLDDAVALYRECLPRSWPLALAPEVAFALIGIRMQARLPAGAETDPAALLALIGSANFLGSAIAGFLALLVFNLALTSHMHAIATGRPASLGRSLGTGVRLAARAVVAAALIGIATGVGFVLLLVPGVYLAGAWLLAFTAMVVGDAGILESMRISARLVKGHWWRAVTIYTIAAVIALVFYVAIGVLFGLSSAPAATAAPLAVGLQRLISVTIGTLMTMWFPAVLLSLYYDLTLRREGADLARQVEELRPDRP